MANFYGRDYSRDDPVTDAEEWASREDNRPVMGVCPVCGQNVCDENDFYGKDDAFEIDGEIIHEDCVMEFLKDRGYKV